MKAKKINKQKLIKILSIIQIVLCSIAIIVSLFSIIYITIGFNKLGENDLIHNIADNIKLGPEAKIEGDRTILWQNSFNTLDLFKEGLFFLLFISILNFLITAYMLFCSIFTLIKIRCRKITKINYISCIIAAILSFVTLNIPIFVVFVILSVELYLVNTDKEKQYDSNNFSFEMIQFNVLLKSNEIITQKQKRKTK